MIFIWGSRTYGAVQKVGNVSVKTVFGHLWYLPFIPKSSYYVNHKNDAAFELNGIHWRSALSAYARVWLTIFAVLMFLLAQADIQGGADQQSRRFRLYAMAFAAILAVIATYLLDKKYLAPETAQVRLMMERQFGVALDPLECLSSLQNDIDEKMRSTKQGLLEQDWYKSALQDAFADKQELELAILRARCDQQDAALQEQVSKRLTQLR